MVRKTREGGKPQAFIIIEVGLSYTNIYFTKKHKALETDVFILCRVSGTSGLL
jgi:hypothetical protein